MERILRERLHLILRRRNRRVSNAMSQAQPSLMQPQPAVSVQSQRYLLKGQQLPMFRTITSDAARTRLQHKGLSRSARSPGIADAFIRNGRIFAKHVKVLPCACIFVRNSIAEIVDRIRLKRTVSTVSKKAGVHNAEDRAYVSMEEKSIDARNAARNLASERAAGCSKIFAGCMMREVRGVMCEV